MNRQELIQEGKIVIDNDFIDELSKMRELRAEHDKRFLKAKKEGLLPCVFDDNKVFTNKEIDPNKLIPYPNHERTQGTAKHKDKRASKYKNAEKIQKYNFNFNFSDKFDNDKRVISKGGKISVTIHNKLVYAHFFALCKKIGLHDSIAYCAYKWYKRAILEDYREAATMLYELYQSNGESAKRQNKEGEWIDTNRYYTNIVLKSLAVNRMNRNKGTIGIDDFIALVDLAINSNRHYNKRNLFSYTVINKEGEMERVNVPLEIIGIDTTKGKKAQNIPETRANKDIGIKWQYKLIAREIAEKVYNIDKSFAVPQSFANNTKEGMTNYRKAQKIIKDIRAKYPDVEKLTPSSINHLTQLYAQGAI